MRLTRIYCLFVLSVFLTATACTSKKRENALQAWEDSLANKEKELLAREKTLDIRETDIVKREQSLDSNFMPDSIPPINPRLAGTWSVKMTCTETTCTGSAVGDTKNEQWELSYQGHLLVAKALSDSRLVRVYSGSLVDNTAELVEERKDSSSQHDIKMTVRLRVRDDSNMEGEREIVRENDCKIIYALQMQKQS